MERTGNQKALLVLSILTIIGSAFALILGFLSLAGGAFMGAAMKDPSVSAQINGQLAGTSLTADAAAGFVFILAALLIVSGVIDLLMGIFGVRAANDNQKVKPAWVFTLIALILAVVSIIGSIVMGTDPVGAITSNIFGLAFSIAMFVVCNNVKKEAGL